MKTNHKPRVDEKNTPPIFATDCGRVRASVWQVKENGSRRYKITVTRSFQQENGEWTRGRTFFQGELPAVVEVTARVQRWIDWQERGQQQQPTLAGI
jgi:hypothetical protein